MPSDRNFLPLTSIRGIAALWVYLQHSQYLTSPSIFFNELAALGYFGVDIFFILSGFIISYVHREDFKTLADVKNNGKRFIILRLARIYPMHIATLIIVLLLDTLHIFNNARDTSYTFGLNLLLLQKSWLTDGLSWNLVSWSISVEWMLYLCFPLFTWAVLARLKSTMSGLFLVLAGLALWAYYLCPSCTASYSEHYLSEPGWSIMHGAVGFLIGLALYQLFALGFLKGLPWDWLAAMAICLLIVFIELRARIKFPDILIIFIFILLIYSLAYVRGPINSLFSLRPLVYLGTISYSFYLLHWIYVIFILLKILPFIQTRSFFSGEFCASTALLIALSTAGYYGIERPARGWLRRYATR